MWFISNVYISFIFKPLHFKCNVSVWTVLVVQSCPTLCNPTDCSPPGFSVHGILQARILEWIAIPSSRERPNPGIEPWSPALQADYLPFELHGSLLLSLYPNKRSIHFKIPLMRKKQRHYFTNKGPSSQSYGFSSSHVWI